MRQLRELIGWLLIGIPLAREGAYEELYLRFSGKADLLKKSGKR